MENNYYICVLDFEATCWKDNKNHEIIEFPSILLEWNLKNNTIKEVSRIQIFVKPKLNPIVSDFCYELTGITQEQVNNGTDLKSAILQHFNWLKENAPLKNVMMLTCGNWDLQTMLPNDAKNINFNLHQIYKSFVNLKYVFEYITNTKSNSTIQMLKHLGLKMEGRLHSGIDDCNNYARIFIKLIEKGLQIGDFDYYIYNIK